MTTPLLYLRPDVQVDPLIHNWYAWVQIISPAPAAFNVLERQIKAMKSFIHSPDMHVQALRNPANRGGPLIDLPAGSVPAVRELLHAMQASTRRQVEFVGAIRELDAMLAARADGSSLQPLYRDIPTALQGYVELVYDRHHRADFRLVEALLYGSPLYDESAQSVALTLFTVDCKRPLIFSAPRLPDTAGIRLPVPLRSPGLDALFSMRTVPATFEQIETRLGVDLDNPAHLRELLTDRMPPPLAPVDPEQPRLRYFGHACVLVEAAGTSILVDPLIPYPCSEGMTRFSYEDLPAWIDYVLITHGQHDHIVLETLLQLRYKISTIVVARNCAGSLHDPSLALMLQHLGFTNVLEIGEFGVIDLPGGAITALPFMGEHHDLQVHSKLCYHLRLGRRTLLFAADSCNFGHGIYERAYQEVGKVDMLFIGMECGEAPASWVYGPLFSQQPDQDKDRSRRRRACNSEEAFALVRLFGCSRVYIYAMGSEPWVRYLLDLYHTDESNPVVQANRLIRACHAQDVQAERLHGAQNIPFIFPDR